MKITHQLHDSPNKLLGAKSPKQTEYLFPTSLGFRLRHEILLIGDPKLVYRRNQIVYAVDADPSMSTALLMFLEYIIPLEKQKNPIYYARMAVRFIREQIRWARLEDWKVLIGGFDSDTPIEPCLYTANKLGVLAKKFQRGMTAHELIYIGECFRDFIQKNEETRATHKLKSVFISSPNSVLGILWHSTDRNDQVINYSLSNTSWFSNPVYP
ncbi:hypothetical protein MKW94_002564 [Papaver nudicaule]|uniref:Uncharacterized protein n=1 Tax=Papaver nudicaule TaxID=74823 RepID=A0AA41S7Z6_PAPNU|nr:hypothetical protein [Papaver nudicaule]